MIYNYLRLFIVTSLRHPFLSIAKVFSLAMGLTASTLVAMHIYFIQDSNKHITDWQNTYRLVTKLQMQDTNEVYRIGETSDAYAPSLLLDYSDRIQKIARIRFERGEFSRGGENLPHEYVWMEEDGIDIFDLDFLNGDPESALTSPNSIVMSELAANKYFGELSPLGKSITIDGDIDLRVTGVFRNLPLNASHPIDIAISASTGTQVYGPNFMSASSGWLQFSGTETFLRLSDTTSPHQMNDNMINFVNRRLPIAASSLAQDLGLELSLQRVDDIYLNPLDNRFAETENTSRKIILYGLMIFSILVLIASCINFSNLTVSSMEYRANEVRVRRVLGAERKEIVLQFLTEAMLLTSVSILIVIPIVIMSIPVYAGLTDTSIQLSQTFTSRFAVPLFLFVVVIGILSGVAPAASIARLDLVQTGRSWNLGGGLKKLTMTSVTVLQYLASTVLILIALAVYVQSNYMRGMDNGFDKDNLVIVDTQNNSTQADSANYDAMRTDFLQHPGIMSVGSSNSLPSQSVNLSQFRLAESDAGSTIGVGFVQASVDLIETYGLELIAGRTFSDDFPSDFATFTRPPDPDRIYGIVVTDLLVERLGIPSPDEALGRTLMLGNISLQIIGIVKRFRLASDINSDERSIGIFVGTRDRLRAILIRLNPEVTQDALAHIDNVWSRHFPSTPIDRSFYSQILDGVIRSRNLGLNIAALIASVITTCIASLGLLALASNVTKRRSKEIGIRKVLGASSNSVLLLLAKDFLKPILVSCVMAWLIAYVLIENYYSSFSVQASFTAIYYLFVSVANVLLALLTICIVCIRRVGMSPLRQ